MLGFDKEELKRICEKYNLSLVILHGSYAKGMVSSKSDVDIGLLGDPEIIKKNCLAMMNDFCSIFGDRFDPVFLNGAEAMITYQVALNGVPLYEKKKGLFSNFKTASILRYMDTKRFRILEKKYLESMISEN